MKNYSKSEDLYLIAETALESSLAGFWDWNMLTNEEYLSPRFKEMFGYEDHEMESSPEAWQKIVFKDDLPVMFKAFDAHVQSKGKIPFISILRYHHKNGQTIWVRCNGKVVEWSDKGEPVRAIGCHIDITEDKELEIKLKKALNERDLLLKEVHHRVKNNLQLILSLARLKDKNDKVDIQEMEDSINSIAHAYEAIYKSDRFEQISIKTYLSQIIKPLIISQDIELQITAIVFDKGIDFLIPIGLVLTELVNNSLKHAFINTEKKTISITIEHINNVLMILYKDNGIGYSQAVLDATEESNSFGIEIVKSLIEQINGTIKFYNDNGAVAKILIDTCTQNIKIT
ncbi:hypothetical protein DNU06_09110 [Putridiphycobacter roseus]|uniref:histidine kinase n=1 Tax=Putridiphycobacter roseus TaxID=2219161 RepID=A0A2W1MYY5_9FLAO|nr:PAS domain-containing protein [Putridiphycobacter roseus]PZE17419.1 hypothetical protein DNU06_09110 [Putridiphycobacter roseus]